MHRQVCLEEPEHPAALDAGVAPTDVTPSSPRPVPMVWPPRGFSYKPLVESPPSGSSSTASSNILATISRRADSCLQVVAGPGGGRDPDPSLDNIEEPKKDNDKDKDKEGSKRGWSLGFNTPTLPSVTTPVMSTNWSKQATMRTRAWKGPVTMSPISLQEATSLLPSSIPLCPCHPR